jgi:hypothetical protein
MRFYVYELTDPRDGSTFYVGKGQSGRASQHVPEARHGGQSAKCDRIREIEAAGFKVGVRITERFEIEADAYAFEAKRIAAIGLRNLTNVMAKGGGVSAPPREKWSKDTFVSLRRILLIPEGTKLFWGPYDVSFIHDVARDAVRNLVRDVGFDKAKEKLGRYHINLMQAEAA